MCDLVDFLEGYSEFMGDDFDKIVCLLRLLPNSYVYLFVRHLLDCEHVLVRGDCRSGVCSVGLIYYDDGKIVLDSEDDSSGVFVLLELPSVWEV